MHDGKQKRPGRPTELFLEGLAVVLVGIGSIGMALIFIGLLVHAIVWAWSWW